LRQLGVTRVDPHYLDCLARLTVPSQPPPLVTAVQCGDERDVTAVVSGQELTAEATLSGWTSSEPAIKVSSSAAPTVATVRQRTVLLRFRAQLVIAQSRRHNAQVNSR
jgi:hypothetical protein